MDTIAWIVTGVIVGWIAYALLGLNSQRGVIMSVILGAVGALAGGKVLAPMFVVETANELSLASVLFAAAAASVLVFVGEQMQSRWGL